MAFENAPQIVGSIVEPWRQAFGDAPPLAILNDSLVPVLEECLDQKDQAPLNDWLREQPPGRQIF